MSTDDEPGAPHPHTPPRSLTFFNNKGGVGKTTLACNLASHLAKDLHLRVLMVDCDPQCNATQLLLREDQWEDIYANRRDSLKRTVLKVLRHIRAGDSEIDVDLAVETSDRFGVDVLPGHPTLSAVEDRLSSSWGDFIRGDVGGARRSLWARSLVRAADKYDLVLFDLGPSLGALNRSVLLGSDTFVTPTAADLFSLYALDNIGDWMKAWTRDYRRGHVALEDQEEFDLLELGLSATPEVAQGYLGYTVQQYVTKNTGGRLRSVNAYDRYRRQVPERARSLAYMQFHPEADLDLDLGLVPNMFSMVPLAQSVHAPIRELSTTDGLRGAQVTQQKKYVDRLSRIASRLVENTGLIVQDHDK